MSTYSIPEDPPWRDRILWLPDAMQKYPEHDVVIVSRVSTATQQKRGSLHDQQDRIRKTWQKYLEQLSHVYKGGLCAVPKFQASGRLNDPKGRQKRQEVVRLARKHHAMLLYEDRTRILRADNAGEIEEPSKEDWDELFAEIGDDIPMATVIPPETPLSEVASLKKKLGMQATSKHAGRPRNVTYKQVLTMLRLRANENPRYFANWTNDNQLYWGMDLIAKEMNLPKSVVVSVFQVEITLKNGQTYRLSKLPAQRVEDYFHAAIRSGQLEKFLESLSSVLKYSP